MWAEGMLKMDIAAKLGKKLSCVAFHPRGEQEEPTDAAHQQGRHDIPFVQDPMAGSGGCAPVAKAEADQAQDKKHRAGRAHPRAGTQAVDQE